MQKPTNPSAFPHDNYDGLASNGLTLRDYFAARALEIIANSDTNLGWIKETGVQQAYQIADAMLEERARQI